MSSAKFEQIYRENIWEGGSGEGSRKHTTIEYRAYLESFLTTHKIKSVCDIGCGDWVVGSLIDWTGIEYYGMDCVDFLIEKHKNDNKDRPNLHFQTLDVCTNIESLPKCDLYILKDVLQHLPNANIVKILDWLYKNGKYVLITNCHGQHYNGQDISIGDCRGLSGKYFPLNCYPMRLVLAYGTKHVYLLEGITGK